LNNYKLLGIPLAILLTITIISAGFTNSAYAHSHKVKVDCKDLGLALLTWDDLYYYADADDLKESERGLADVDIKPDTYEDIIDEHMEDLSNKFGTKCDEKVDEEIFEKWNEDVDFNRPSGRD
jgi:hypothetical protein